MRFRGVLSDTQQISSLVRVLQSFAKFSDTFLVRLSQNEMQLLNDRSNTSTAFVVKCVLNCDDYFQEYSFNGVNTDNNFICFRLRSESLTQVLSSFLSNIKALKLRLSKSSVNSHDCVLSIAVDYPTHDSDRIVCHQIKIEIIRIEEWDDICQQDISQFDLSLQLPDSRAVSAITERMNDLCHYIEINAKKVDTNKAFLAINVETDSIAIKTKFSHLDINTNEDNELIVNNSDSLVSIRIDVRKMNLLFNTLKHLRPTSVISNIRDKQIIYFQFFHNLVNFQAFLPNIEV